MEIRLQKIIADAGLASRRQAEQWILEGRVRVNGRVMNQLGAKADPATDRIQVNGKSVGPEADRIYLVLNKPPGCLTTMVRDSRGRPTVMEFVKKAPGRVFPVGRLDFNTQGILLFTNDGDLGRKLLSPRFEVRRTYEVKVRGVPEEKALARLRKGVPLDGKPTAPIEVEVLRTSGNNSFLRMHLVEGKNRHIKRVCEAVRHAVIRLKRTHFGPLNLSGLPLGAWRFLTPRELKALRACGRENPR
ncbi:MAG: ribosomal large subunit pseudouridine synthase B [Nitrospinae bacterium CG11_big_fil_rev_8_21_14_0_20_56_8]|nr:MAG: ribosomal large subunit pseudouridine synthase B [Nitrospinae bacterium CG11_big_fil_rev_8_21_14_0_20_56_8]